MPFAIALLVGPGGIEVDRLRDLFDAILHFEGRRLPEAHVYLVNDGNAAIAELSDALRPFGRTVHLRNPLAGGESSPFDKMTAGMIHALSEAARHGPYRFVLKLDTDALVINPFSDRLAAFFESHPGTGMAGSFLRFPDGSDRPGNAEWAPVIRHATHPSFARRAGRNPWRVAASLIRIARRRALLASARRGGYRDGFHVLGGSYAVAGKVLESWAKRSVDRMTLLFRDTGLSEDVVISLLVSWLGYRLADFNAAGEVFGTWHKEFRVPAEQLLVRYSIIHSVKSGERQSEQVLREFFREDRRSRSALPDPGNVMV